MAKRIGAKMAQAVEIVRANPGCSMRFVAEQISPLADPARNWAYGYNPIHRARKAGLIVAKFGAGNAYALYVKEV